MNPRHEQFVVAYLGPAKGNATSAAKSVGCSDASAGVMGAKWLKRPDVQRAIRQRLAKVDLSTQARLERLGILADHTPKETSAADVIRANELILKVNGALKDKQAHAGITVNIGFLTPTEPTPFPAMTVNAVEAEPAVMPSQAQDGQVPAPGACAGGAGEST